MKIFIKSDNADLLEWQKQMVMDRHPNAEILEDVSAADFDMAIVGLADYSLLKELYERLPMCKLIVDADRQPLSAIPNLPVPVRAVISLFSSPLDRYSQYSKALNF